MPLEQPKPNPKGRGSHLNLPNRFEAVRLELDFEQCEGDEELIAELDHHPTEYFADASQSVVTENDSPDIGFRFSLNPYRGWRMAARIATLGRGTNISASTPGSISRAGSWSSSKRRCCCENS